MSSSLKISRFFLIALGLTAILFPAQGRALDCREDYHCVLVQDRYCNIVKSVPEKAARKWRRENLKEAAARAKEGEICTPALPNTLYIENYFPLCLGGTCVAAMIPGR